MPLPDNRPVLESFYSEGIGLTHSQTDGVLLPVFPSLSHPSSRTQGIKAGLYTTDLYTTDGRE